MFTINSLMAMYPAMEQQLLQQPLAVESWGLRAHPGKHPIRLPVLLLTGHLLLATGPAWSSPGRDLHGTGEEAEDREQEMGQMERYKRLKET